MAKESTRAKATRGTATKRGRRGTKKESAISIRADLSHYKIGEAKTATGRRTIDIGDATAELLSGKSLDEVYKVASKKLGESEPDLREQYKHLNPGMVRMNLATAFVTSGSRRRRMITLNHEEASALRYVLGTVAAEADRMEESDPEAWAAHAEALDSLIADYYCEDGCVTTLDDKERAGMASLRAKLL
jgi:hypothetical protein